MVLFALVGGRSPTLSTGGGICSLPQSWMAICATVLAFLAAAGELDAWNLLILTFALGIGASMATPALNVTAPELVPRNLLPQAVALGSLSINLSRSIGPAIGGTAAIAVRGHGCIQPERHFVHRHDRDTLVLESRPDERSRRRNASFQALRAGLRYATGLRPSARWLIRTIAFILFTISAWALLPPDCAQ